MYTTNSLVIILPNGKEYSYQVGNNEGTPEITRITIFDNNIAITFKSRGPIIWIMDNIAGFSHDQELQRLVRPEPVEVIEHSDPVQEIKQTESTDWAGAELVEETPAAPKE